MNRKIVFEGLSKKGNKITICYPTSEDAQDYCDYINALSKEKTFITFQGEGISFEDETKYLNSVLDKIDKKQSVQLLVFCGDKLIGISSIDMKNKVESHVGVFGISIARDYRGEGIGKVFMQSTLEESQKVLSQLRIITLGVFGNNPVAKNIYEKLGFKEYGRLPEGIVHNSEYVDHIYMYKNVKS